MVGMARGSGGRRAEGVAAAHVRGDAVEPRGQLAAAVDGEAEGGQRGGGDAAGAQRRGDGQRGGEGRCGEQRREERGEGLGGGRGEKGEEHAAEGEAEEPAQQREHACW
jgi:hypothetical protein